MIERGLTWFEWQELYRDKLRAPLTVTFAFVATHNHFVLDRGGKVFNRTAPVIKLPEGATEDDHLALLGCPQQLDSVLLAQAGEPRPRAVVALAGSHRTKRGSSCYEFTGTKPGELPAACDPPLELGRELDAFGPATRRRLATYDRRLSGIRGPDDRASGGARLGRVSPVQADQR